MTVAAVVLAALTAAASPVQAEPPAPLDPLAPAPAARLRGLDKFSGLTEDFTAGVNAPARYARLTVTVRACVGRGADSRAWLEITDAKDPSRPVFAGWMMAASPALSALDHPRYDVWVLACSTVSGEAS